MSALGSSSKSRAVAATKKKCSHDRQGLRVQEFTRSTTNTDRGFGRIGVLMIATQIMEQRARDYSPSTEDFAALLDESLSGSAPAEGSVVKGKIVAIEKDLAVIDVGLKTEGRVPLKECGISGQQPSLGDE